MPQLFVQLAQLFVALSDQIKRASTHVILLRHRREASLADVLELTEESLDHLLDVVRIPVHVPVCQETSSFKQDGLVHLLVLQDLLVIVSGLTQLVIAVSLQFLPLRELLVDVGLQLVVRHLDVVFALLVFLLVFSVVLVNVFVEQVVFFLLDLVQRRLQGFNRLLQ